MLTHIVVDNVRDAYPQGLTLLRDHGERQDSRNGPVLVHPGPVITTYTKPNQRVLLDVQRDANPFFHLMEAFWMLAGRRDVESLMHYNAGMKKYSDDGVNFHGAYGYRWRRHFVGVGDAHNLDQLAVIIEALRRDPLDRRIVLQMWDAETDLGREGLDFPCNTQVYFRVRQVRNKHPDAATQEFDEGSHPVLDMTLTCRSNDAIWGAYGANAVHFSVLQEFVASMIGVRVGEMHQLSNNFHAYVEPLERVTQPYWPVEPAGSYGPVVPLFGDLSSVPVGEVFSDLDTLWDDDQDGEVDHLPATTIQLVAGMRRMWAGWKSKDWMNVVLGNQLLEDSGHMDWSQATGEWMVRRRDKFA